MKNWTGTLVILAALSVRGLAHAAVTVSISAPAAGALSGTPLQVAATVSSTYQVSSVVAQVGTAQGALTFSSATGSWNGSLPLTGVAFGTQQLTVLATDSLGGQGSATTPFVFDRRPAVSVTSPDDGDLARPSIHVSATCAEDGPSGCTALTLTATAGSTSAVLASGTSSIDTVVSLAAFDGLVVTLSFEGRDSAGQTTIVTRTSSVEAGAALVEIVRLPGTSTVLDLSANRVLHVGSVPVGSVPAGSATLIRTIATGQDQVIGVAATTGFLTETGAIFAAASHIYEWRNGSLIDVRGQTGGSLNDPGSRLSVKGTWAAYFDSVYLPGYGALPAVSRRDLTTGTSQLYDGPPSSPHATHGGLDVAPNGDVVFGFGNYVSETVYRIRGGVLTPIATGGSGSPITDGANVVHSAGARFIGPSTPRIGLVDATGVDRNLTTEPRPSPVQHKDYDAVDGWVAFTRPAPDATLQVWLLSPSAVESQITFSGTSSELRAMGTSGRLAFVNGGRLYVTGPGGSNPRDVASSLGTILFRGGDFYDVFGGIVFRIADTTDPGSTSRLTLISGTVNGQPVSSTVRTVNVAPGQAITGQIQVEMTSTWPAGSVMAMGMTPTWGTHATSFTDLGGFATPASALPRSVPISLTAPTAPGVYRIVLAFRADLTAADVMSSTNYAVGGDVWDNGDDVAGWTSPMLASADAAGTVLASYLFPGGSALVYVPATTLIVVVGGGTGGGCATSGGTLCLLNRFRLSVTWKNPYDGGSTGVGTAIPYSVNTGMFWFFEAPNLELMVKMLDGTGVNGRFWLFYGALSDVEYAITVTDTVTGVARTYRNLPRTLASVADVNAF